MVGWGVVSTRGLFLASLISVAGLGWGNAAGAETSDEILHGLDARTWPASPDPAARTLSVCPEGCLYADIAAAARTAQDGDRIEIAAGIYETGIVVRANHITVSAHPGAIVRKGTAEGKAAIVVKGADTVIEGLECSDIAVPSQNGACVRLEGHNLLLRNVHFHDAEEGVLTAPHTGWIVVEDSVLERLGANGYAHGLYIADTDGLLVRRSKILASRTQGHEVKSRAVQTIILDSTIASLDGVDSRLIDLPNGGDALIRNCVLEKGPGSVNHDLIGYGLEGVSHERNSLTLDHVVALADVASGILVHGEVRPAYKKVTVVGDAKPADASDSVLWKPTREAAGLGLFPQLPAPAVQKK